MDSPYFTDPRALDGDLDYLTQDGWPQARGRAAATTSQSLAGLPVRSAAPPPLPPPGEFDTRSVPIASPGVSRRGQVAAAQEQRYRRSAEGRGHVPSGHATGAGYDDHLGGHQDTGGYPASARGDYPAYDGYLVHNDRPAAPPPRGASFVATTPAPGGRTAPVGRTGMPSGFGGTGALDREGVVVTDARPGGRSAAGRGPAARPAAGAPRPRGERADRSDGGQRAPGAHRAPAGRQGSARARLAIASTASLAGLSALVGTAVLATDTSPLTIQPGAGGTASGQWQTGDATDVAAGAGSGGGGTTRDTPHLTPAAPTGTHGTQQSPAVTAPETGDPPASSEDFTGGVVYGDGGYVNAAGPLSPTSAATDSAANATAGTAGTQAQSSSAPQGALGDWLGIGGLGDVLGTGSPSASPESVGVPGSFGVTGSVGVTGLVQHAELVSVADHEVVGTVAASDGLDGGWLDGHRVGRLPAGAAGLGGSEPECPGLGAHLHRFQVDGETPDRPVRRDQPRPVDGVRRGRGHRPVRLTLPNTIGPSGRARLRHMEPGPSASACRSGAPGPTQVLQARAR